MYKKGNQETWQHRANFFFVCLFVAQNKLPRLISCTKKFNEKKKEYRQPNDRVKEDHAFKTSGYLAKTNIMDYRIIGRFTIRLI